jgi:hypothetical protein
MVSGKWVRSVESPSQIRIGFVLMRSRDRDLCDEIAPVTGVYGGVTLLMRKLLIDAHESGRLKALVDEMLGKDASGRADETGTKSAVDVERRRVDGNIQAQPARDLSGSTAEPSPLVPNHAAQNQHEAPLQTEGMKTSATERNESVKIERPESKSVPDSLFRFS